MLSRRIASVRERLLDMMARLEAALDFSEEGYDFIGSAEVAEGVKVALEELEELAGTFVRGRATVGGIEAAILGRPNAGKSTLLNRLIGTDRAIVTPIAGTTRDILRESIEIGGLPVVLMDTAGLRNNADVVEEIGIARAREAARRAEIVIYLVDSAVGMTDEDLSELRMLADPVVVFTKSDLVSRHEPGLSISVNNNSGIDRLLSVLDTRVRERYAAADGALVNERQLSAVRTACRHLRLVQSSLEQGAPETLLLVDLRAAATSLAALMGEITTDEIFAEIFGKFCIGK
jgi:tRNA modification GTPase